MHVSMQNTQDTLSGSNGNDEMMNRKCGSYLSIITCAVLLELISGAEGSQNDAGLKELEPAGGGVAISWASRSGRRVLVNTPTLIAEDPNAKANPPITLKLTSHTTKDRTARLNYQVALDRGDRRIGGTLQVSIALPQNRKQDLLLYRTQLEFDRPVRMDVTVQYRFQIRDAQAGKIILPERDGYLRSYPLTPGRSRAGRYELGARAAGSAKCPQLGIPVVGLVFGKESGDSKAEQLAVSIDPYCGGHIQASPAGKHTFATVSTTYHGAAAPMTREKRTVAMEFHRTVSTTRFPRSSPAPPGFTTCIWCITIICPTQVTAGTKGSSTWRTESPWRIAAAWRCVCTGGTIIFSNTHTITRPVSC